VIRKLYHAKDGERGRRRDEKRGSTAQNLSGCVTKQIFSCHALKGSTDYNAAGHERTCGGENYKKVKDNLKKEANKKR